jgi:hypothetical protein
VVAALRETSVHEAWVRGGVPESQRLAMKAMGNITTGMTSALSDIWLCRRLNFMSPSADKRSSSSWSIKSWYSQCDSFTSEGFPP